MAEVTVTPKEIKQKIEYLPTLMEYEIPEKYNLTLTKGEANVLLAILYNVAGDPKETLRGVSDHILDKLKESGKLINVKESERFAWGTTTFRIGEFLFDSQK